MAVDTSTIRVSRQTRDLLAEQASARGVSVGSLVAQLAEDVDRAEVYRSEREATRIDAGSSTAQAEDRDWDTTLADGID